MLGFDDSSSGGRLNRLWIKKIQKGWGNSAYFSSILIKKIRKWRPKFKKKKTVIWLFESKPQYKNQIQYLKVDN